MKEQGTGNVEQGTVGPNRLMLRSRWMGAGVIVAAALLAASPLLLRGASCGHDFDFHLVSWFDALQSWRQGIIYPHWATSPNYGAGEPRFVFYPPLTWMLGAALGAVLPWTLVPWALTFLLLAGAGLATRALARQALTDGPATLAGCIAIFSGYSLYTAYERSAFAELAGGTWIPLLLLFILKEAPNAGSSGRRVLDRNALLLALVVAGAWLSNAPVGVMASYLLAGVALTLALLTRSWAPVLRAALGCGLGLALAAFYLGPAIVEQRWIDISDAVNDPGSQIKNSFLFGHHANPLLAGHDIELRKVSWIAVALFATTLVGLLASWRRGKLPGARRFWVPLALIPMVILLLQLPISLPAWNVLPKLEFLQFPWRWLVVLAAPMSIFAACAVWPAGRGRRWLVTVLCAAVFIGLTVYAGRTWFQVCDDEDAVQPMRAAWQDGTGFQGYDEYAPPGADDSLVAINLPDACLVDDAEAELGKPDPVSNPDWAADQHSCIATYDFAAAPGKALNEHRRIHAKLSRAGYLILRLRRYPAWDVRVNGVPATQIMSREDGLIAVAVPAGALDVTVDWTTTRDVSASRWLCVIALALITALSALGLRRTRPQLK